MPNKIQIECTIAITEHLSTLIRKCIEKKKRDISIASQLYPNRFSTGTFIDALDRINRRTKIPQTKAPPPSKCQSAQANCPIIFPRHFQRNLPHAIPSYLKKSQIIVLGQPASELSLFSYLPRAAACSHLQKRVSAESGHWCLEHHSPG